MEKLDLATHSREIKENYEKVVRGSPDATFAVFTSQKAVLAPTMVGDGGMEEFVEEFEEGRVQFGIIRVYPPGSDVKKIVLLGWCPDSAPVKSRSSFAQNFAEVATIFRGYHVQVTARDQDDLDVDDILKTVGAASGARYSIQSQPQAKTTPKPVAKSFSKPVEKTSKSWDEPVVEKKKPSSEEDEWGGEKEIETRDFNEKPLQSAPSAYKPTKVDMDSLRGTKPAPVPVKRELPPKKELPHKIEVETKKEEPFEPKKEIVSVKSLGDGRLFSMPKPKVSHNVASRYNPTVTPSVKVPTFGAPPKSDKAKVVHGASRNFASENGKTPAQIWAEKHGKYTSASPEPVTPQASHEPPRDEFENEDSESEKESEQSVASIREKLAGARLEQAAAAPSKPEPEEPESEPEVEESKPEPQQTPQRNLPPPPARTQGPERSFSPPPAREEAKAPSLPSRVSEPEKTTPSPPVEVQTEKVSSAPTATAEYSYEKDEDNEIGFEEGEKITDIEFVDEDWWQGKNSKGETGLFPASYVNLDASDGVKTPQPEPEQEPEEQPEPKTSSGKSAVAEYDYDASEDNELTFKEGDVIEDIEFVDEDWWLGSLNGEKKLFPANFVTLN